MHDESHRCDRRLGCHTGDEPDEPDEPDELDRSVRFSPHPFLAGGDEGRRYRTRRNRR
jgi:hypothetical protein